MLKESNNSVLLIESNQQLRSIIRNILKQVPEINIIERNKLEKADLFLKEKSVNLIITNSNVANISSLSFCKNFKTKYSTLSTNIVVITKNKDLKHLLGYLENGADYILSLPFKPEYLILIVKKCCGLINSKIETEIRYKNLLINKNKRYLIYKEVLIKLSIIEYLMLELLFKEKSSINTYEIQKYLNYKFKEVIPQKYIYLYISRINKKFEKQTGLKLIKNEYRVGYYLAI